MVVKDVKRVPSSTRSTEHLLCPRPEIVPGLVAGHHFFPAIRTSSNQIRSFEQTVDMIRENGWVVSGMYVGKGAMARVGLAPIKALSGVSR